MFPSQASCIDFLPDIFGPKQNLNSRVIFPAPKIDTCAILKISHLSQLGALGPNLLQWKRLVALNPPSGFKLQHYRILCSYVSQSTPSPMLFHQSNWIQLVFMLLGCIWALFSHSCLCLLSVQSSSLEMSCVCSKKEMSPRNAVRWYSILRRGGGGESQAGTGRQ